ncbi:MAG: hypothetical protein GY953_19480 [bacterium]|nr:hypothetical protein [bacterium]
MSYSRQLESGWRVPEFQFDGDAVLAGIGDVVAALDPELHPIAIQNWFAIPNPDLIARDLGEKTLSPRDWLRLGFPPQSVAERAKHL